ncbi:MAG: biotin--[acetyl-CoA-carboxylase] ligase [Bacteroidota bacterium]|nr:biotin--[acetyl-CoA-carboxylase] ligase [Bacteroidota bacterium]MDX5430057.1 biotin--[acetyl-CoA-carboxylase] ligase [Bacteroidota bacterium]MDX5468827.1 biotin--[acetyl-CoA-carboxylase] ligase [Bacteroidota bacterium]
MQSYRTLTLHYPSLPSTNDLAKKLFEAGDIGHGTAIRADFQEKGRGQMGQSWLGNPGENIYVSLVLEVQVPVERQFYLNMAVCLALRETLAAYLPDVKIKWPNDLYCQRQKLAGILIENHLQGANIHSSIIGIGVNVNQTDFGPLTKAGSIATLLGHAIDLKSFYQNLISALETRLSALNEEQEIWDSYHQSLLFFREVTTFEQEGRLFKAEVKGIDSWGRLVLESSAGTEYYGIKEIRWVDL